MLGRDVGYGPEHVQTRRHMLGLQGDFTGGTEHRAGLWHLSAHVPCLYLLSQSHVHLSLGFFPCKMGIIDPASGGFWWELRECIGSM